MKIYVGTFVATLIAKFPILFMVTVFTSTPTVTVFTSTPTVTMFTSTPTVTMFTSTPTVTMFTFIRNLQMLLWLLCFYKAFFAKQKGTLLGGQHIRLFLLDALRNVAKSDY